MHELTITPQGQLVVRETPSESSGRLVSTALLDAYATGPARGMLYSAGDGAAAALPPDFEYARSIARLYLTELCRVVAAEPTGAAPARLPPPALLDEAVLRAPPMTGLEYLTPEVLAGWWHDLDALTRAEIARHSGGAQCFASGS